MTGNKRRTKKADKREASRQKGWWKWPYGALLILAALFIGIGGGWLLARQREGQPSTPLVQLAAVSQLPDKVRRAPPVVQEAYRFAIANPDVVDNLPCFCGCGSMGHESNLNCFIERITPDGAIAFGYHALE